MVVYEYGVDIKKDLTFSNGDLELIEYEDNIVQAISNRLNTVHDSLDLFYEDYGSVLRGFAGWKHNNTTLKFIKLEVESCLKKDPRISELTTDLEYMGNGNISIKIHLVYGNETLDLNYVLDDNGISEVEE